MPKFKVTGSHYEPGEFAGPDGYIRFWDVVEADSDQEAIDMTHEDYGEYTSVVLHGTVKNAADERAWLANNPPA